MSQRLPPETVERYRSASRHYNLSRAMCAQLFGHIDAVEAELAQVTALKDAHFKHALELVYKGDELTTQLKAAKTELAGMRVAFTMLGRGA